MVKQDLQVTAVGLEVDVKEIAQKRNASTNGIGSEISQHSDELVLRNAKSTSFIDDKKADQRASGITHSGDQSKDRICAKSNPGSWYPYGSIHHPGETVYSAHASYAILVVDVSGVQYAPAFGANLSVEIASVVRSIRLRSIVIFTAQMAFDSMVQPTMRGLHNAHARKNAKSLMRSNVTFNTAVQAGGGVGEGSCDIGSSEVRVETRGGRS
jgi:hypothetical protein